MKYNNFYVYLDIPKATRAVTPFLSMQNDTFTLQEQLL